jgi:hypothetical protein
VSTLGGESGTAVCVDGRIIAIHNGSGKGNEEFNVGRLITSDLINNIKKWILELKADLCTILEIKMCPHLNDYDLSTMIADQKKLLEHDKKPNC